MRAVPVVEAKAPTIDGSLRDWDLSAAEPIWITSQTADALHASVALLYSQQALYVGAQISLPGRGIRNPNNPTDAFWQGDLLELRLASDPALPYPLAAADPRVAASDRVAHLSLWKNSQTGKDFINITYGVGLDKGTVVNPAGTQIIVRQTSTHGYSVEARVPWSVLHVPGGTNPFPAGQKMTAIWGLHWGGDTQTPALYRVNPGAFAFQQPQAWGQMEFSPQGHVAPRHPTMAQALASLLPKPVGVPFTVHVPAPLKVSVNIFGPHGEVLREIIGGESHSKGKLTLYWDGRDQWGAPLAPGTYRWGAYFSPGLRARYMGAVGTSGQPPYETEDGTGGWGSDHGPCIATAADASGLYFLWTSAEDGRAIVKTDYAGRVLWRKTPFVGGGFGPHYAVASNGKYVFLTFEDANLHLVRLDAATGQLLPFGADAAPVVAPGHPLPVPEGSAPILNKDGRQPDAVGLAASGSAVFFSDYSQNAVLVLSPDTGSPVRQMACPGPRGLCLSAAGDLYAASCAPGQTPQIVKFTGAVGAGQPLVKAGLAAPWGVAVDARGLVHVSDLGTSQQIKTFSADGRLLSTLGKAGGRTWAGTYDPSSFLMPAGLAADMQGGILVAEASPPKVMSRWDAATGKPLARWFGKPGYTSTTWPDPDDPMTAYYALESPESFGRATVPAPGASGLPSASWALPQAGISGVGTLLDSIGTPAVLTAKNGRQYLVADSNPHGICLVEGDRLRPVGSAHYYNTADKDNRVGRAFLEMWSDLNGDGQKQRGEVITVDAVGGRPLPDGAQQTGSQWMEPNGDLYLVTEGNSILKVPSAGFDADGAVRWNASHISVVVPSVLPSAGRSLFTGWRTGILGVRPGAAGDIYTCFNATVDTLDGPPQPFTYFTKDLAAQMREGLGHTAESNTVKFAHFDKNGHLLWMAGRKATAAARPGEMYHFWILGGLVGPHGNEYVAGASESGQMYFYTHDGFFVDALMNNPGLAPPAGPYTFGSETFGGRVQSFPKRREVWAYSSGRAFRVNGFGPDGTVAGERRVLGTVKLDKTYSLVSEAKPVTPLQIVPLIGQPLSDASAWTAVPVSTLMRSGSELATAQAGYDTQFLYARFHVLDPTPLRNGADTNSLVFKGGDAVGLDIGPSGTRATPVVGDVRLLAAQIGGRARLVAMKPLTGLGRQPEDYFTPSSGHVRFQFVGEVPGGQVTLTPDANGKGYTATFAVPRSFLEVSLGARATLAADVEVLLSGQGALGLQALSRNYLFTPRRSETTMINDIPTEARLYPQFWGQTEVK